MVEASNAFTCTYDAVPEFSLVNVSKCSNDHFIELLTASEYALYSSDRVYPLDAFRAELFSSVTVVTARVSMPLA